MVTDQLSCSEKNYTGCSIFPTIFFPVAPCTTSLMLSMECLCFSAPTDLCSVTILGVRVSPLCVSQSLPMSSYHPWSVGRLPSAFLSPCLCPHTIPGVWVVSPLRFSVPLSSYHPLSVGHAVPLSGMAHSALPGPEKSAQPLLVGRVLRASRPHI